MNDSSMMDKHADVSERGRENFLTVPSSSWPSLFSEPSGGEFFELETHMEYVSVLSYLKQSMYLIQPSNRPSINSPVAS